MPSILLGSFSLLIFQKGNVTELKAYSEGKLPTTIDLNDSSSDEIRNYYSGLNSLENNERTGTNLLKYLKPILSNGQIYYSYDNNKKIWQMYEITDRDWAKSPANEITYGTYDETTNTITGYVYGSSDSDSKNNPYVHALYNNRNLDNQAKAWGNHNQDGWGINQEHIWAKSHGFDTKGSDGSGGARGDPMHLWAGNGWANHEHSNYFFAYVDKNRSYSDAGEKYQTAYGNLTGYSLTVGGEEKVFEPQDSDKGDIARAIFYMAARYNYYSGSDESPIDGNNPNLILLNDLSENSRTGTSTATSPYGMGLISDLLEWNKLDPVDDYEIHRNNLLFNNYTKNRNPFIDFPQWADLIWGSEVGSKYAAPNLDRINDAGLSVSVNQINLNIDETKEITASTSNNSNITWTISDNTIVELSKTTSSSGEKITVKALKKGSATITVKAIIDGEELTKNIKVTVTEQAKPNYLLYIAIGGGVILLVIIVIVIYVKGNKKTKKKISSGVKKAIKNYTKSSSSKKSGSSKKKK